MDCVSDCAEVRCFVGIAVWALILAWTGLWPGLGSEMWAEMWSGSCAEHSEEDQCPQHNHGYYP